LPELPEVETVRAGLARLILGKVVKSVDSDNPKSFPNSDGDVSEFLLNSSIANVRRRAKVLMIDLSTGYTLVIHLKMTGQLVYVGKERFGAGHPSDSLIDSLPDKSTRVQFEFNDGTHLYFNDQRKFGWVKLIPTLEVPNMSFMMKVGPEPLAADFTAADFTKRFMRRQRTNIKAAILDQTVIAGVGNIYADESLWGAKIHPSRLVASITPAEFDELYKDVRYVMNLSIEKGGSTNRNYVNAEGKKGSYMDFARVFRREGQSCPRCGTEIIKLRVAGRGTHICPQCQVL
jgi:formamidopyrimidine-DNA glycosylase